MFIIWYHMPQISEFRTPPHLFSLRKFTFPSLPSLLTYSALYFWYISLFLLLYFILLSFRLVLLSSSLTSFPSCPPPCFLVCCVFYFALVYNLSTPPFSHSLCLSLISLLSFVFFSITLITLPLLASQLWIFSFMAFQSFDQSLWKMFYT